MGKLVFHVDVNSAYLSWEAARRVANGEPDIRLIPAVIGGDREKRTGVVLAKSIPAKKFGIKTGEPIGMALRKCPDLFMARPDFKLYEESSRKFMDICREYAPVVEKASIDECYLDMSGTHRIYPDPVALAHTIKDRIRNEFGFTVNVGIGENKLLAKMGKHIHDYANGVDPSPVLEEPEEAKGYSISTTLEEDVRKADQAYPVLLALADSVTARIRSDGAKAYCVAVTIRDNSFKTRSHQRSLMNPTDISKEVYQISKELFNELWDGATPLRLLGIALTNITREETMQFSLFQDDSREKSRKLDKAKDALNAKFGSATIVRGSSIQSKIDVGKKYKAQMELQNKKGE